MAFLELEEICHSYGDAEVLSNVSLALDTGESLAIVSPSGSGKSTLLSIAGLLLEPSAGSVRIDGVDTASLNDIELSALRSKTFGFLFQHTQLVGSLRAQENVLAPALFLDLPHSGMEEMRDRARDLLCEFGLGERLDYFPFQISGGQKRRVMAARALLLQPKILIADEPTNDMDHDSAASVTKALFDHVKGGGALLMATHDPDLAACCERVITL